MKGQLLSRVYSCSPSDTAVRARGLLSEGAIELEELVLVSVIVQRSDNRGPNFRSGFLYIVLMANVQNTLHELTWICGEEWEILSMSFETDKD